jgi:uncharacterized membrane protein
MSDLPFAPPGEPRAKSVVRLLVAVAMVSVGITHFTNPDPFVGIVPRWLPAPLVLVYVSGFFEVLGGAGLLVRRVQVAAAWGLVALYVAVFPANLNMAVNHIHQLGTTTVPEWGLWVRLPFQAVFIGVAYWLSRTPRPSQPAA